MSTEAAADEARLAAFRGDWLRLTLVDIDAEAFRMESRARAGEEAAAACKVQDGPLPTRARVTARVYRAAAAVLRAEAQRLRDLVKE